MRFLSYLCMVCHRCKKISTGNAECRLEADCCSRRVHAAIAGGRCGNHGAIPARSLIGNRMALARRVLRCVCIARYPSSLSQLSSSFFALVWPVTRPLGLLGVPGGLGSKRVLRSLDFIAAGRVESGADCCTWPRGPQAEFVKVNSEFPSHTT